MFQIPKGGLLCLLSFFFLIADVSAQSYFTGQILPDSKSYGSVQTRLLPPEVASLLQKQDFTFEQWSSFFYLKTAPSQPAILGSYAVQNGQVLFKPKFLPDPKLKYIVSFSFPKLAALTGQGLPDNGTYNDVISFEPPASSQPEVTSVLPSLDDKTPANILRLYVTFSAPMGIANPYEYIDIKDASGKILTDPFVEIPQGLWNIDKTRLTLLLHPGRVKQGVGPNITQGDVLEEGNTYTLEINSNWEGASGSSLKNTYSRKFTVAAPIRTAINVNRWALTAKQDQLGELTIITDQPLDQPLAQRMLYIQGADGNLLPTRVEFMDRKRLKILWAAQNADALNLIIDPRLEDICGNTPLGAFDLEGASKAVSSEPIKLRFRID